MLELYTSYFGNYRKIPQYYRCISVANSRPASICVPKWNDVIPNWSMVENYKLDLIDFDEFSTLYKCQLKLKRLCAYEKYLTEYDLPIVLLCWEKDASKCHRSVLAKFLNENFNHIIEYKGEYRENNNI